MQASVRAFSVTVAGIATVTAPGCAGVGERSTTAASDTCLVVPVGGMIRPDSGDAGLRLAEVIAALSLAVDLGTGQQMDYALRSCVLAVRLGDAMGLGDHELHDTYYLSLLRFVGCNAETHVEAAALGDEIAAREWMAFLNLGKPMEMLAAIILKVGAGTAPLQHARMVATALINMPKMMELSAAHCEVAQMLAARLSLGPVPAWHHAGVRAR